MHAFGISPDATRPAASRQSGRSAPGSSGGGRADEPAMHARGPNLTRFAQSAFEEFGDDFVDTGPAGLRKIVYALHE